MPRQGNVKDMGEQRLPQNRHERRVQREYRRPLPEPGRDGVRGLNTVTVVHPWLYLLLEVRKPRHLANVIGCDLMLKVRKGLI